tara:strand:- start:162 stop:770 length:609 start_codon:yes stop_codon:yes gene_type:complete
LEILIIFGVYVIYKLFTFSNEGKELENIGDVTPTLEITYDESSISKNINKKNNNIENKVKTKTLTIKDLTTWLENPSPNRSFYSLAIVFNIIFTERPNITVVSSKILMLLEEKSVNSSVEIIYENIVRLWNDSSLNTDYIKLIDNNFVFSPELLKNDLPPLLKLFNNSINNQNNLIFNKNKVIKDLNYLFEIITKESDKDFL